MTKSYEGYMSSEGWRIRKRELLAIESASNCYCCGCTHQESRLEAHHITYENFGDEKPGDVVPICRVCHLMVHEWLWGTPVRAATEAVKRVRQGPMKQPAPIGFDLVRPFNPEMQAKRKRVRERKRDRKLMSKGLKKMTFGQEQSLR